MKLGGNEVLSGKEEDKVVGKGEIGMRASWRMALHLRFSASTMVTQVTTMYVLSLLISGVFTCVVMVVVVSTTGRLV